MQRCPVTAELHFAGTPPGAFVFKLMDEMDEHAQPSAIREVRKRPSAGSACMSNTTCACKPC